MRPLFYKTENEEYRLVVPEVFIKNRKSNPTKFISKIVEKVKDLPEKIRDQDLGFLTIAGYIFLELCHKNDIPIIDEETNKQFASGPRLTVIQAMVLFAVGIKIGQMLPSDVEILEKPWDKKKD